MKLIAISPESDDARELSALPRLFAAGLGHYHLRKPAWDRARLAAWLRTVPEEFHPRLVLHTHHDLACDFALGGLHHRGTTDIPVRADRPPGDPFRAGKNVCATPAFTSRACHDLPALHAALGHVSRVLLSPVFPSISKPGHAPDHRLPRSTVADILARRTPAERRTEVVALGGIDASRLADCRALGFDAVAVLGAIWGQSDPHSAFLHLQAALSAHAR